MFNVSVLDRWDGIAAWWIGVGITLLGIVNDMSG